jgi:predicted TIM-barrel fold metal-dependent hydrolase
MVGPGDYAEFVEACKRFPGRFFGYVNINPSSHRAAARVKKAAKDGFKGIKLYPSAWKNIHAYDKVCYPVYEEALRHDLLVFLHFGVSIGAQADLRHCNPIDIQLPSRDFPDLRFIIAHFGAGWFREALLLQYQTDNVYLDSSGSNIWMNYLPYDLDIKRVFRKAIQAGGSEKIIFGTDSSFFPRGFRFNIMETQYRALQELSLEPNPAITRDDIDRIMRKNILEMTGFKPTTS